LGKKQEGVDRFLALVRARLVAAGRPPEITATFLKEPRLNCRVTLTDDGPMVATAQFRSQLTQLDLPSLRDRPRFQGAYASLTSEPFVALNTVASGLHGPLSSPSRNGYTYDAMDEYSLDAATLDELLGLAWTNETWGRRLTIKGATGIALHLGLLNGSHSPPSPAENVPEPKKVELSLSAASETLYASLGASGWVFEPFQLAAFLAAARTKPFVILSGVSGTGKSQLPARIAAATGIRCERVAVRPDWTDSSDVIGYIDLKDSFRIGQFGAFVQAAMTGPGHRFVVVDEMNLARVEQYFAEVLSAMEADDGERTLRTPTRTDGTPGPALHLPANLTVVGTVNMDETTHGFSRKVLDRAFTIEFSSVHLDSWQGSASAPTPVEFPSAGWSAVARRPSALPEPIQVAWTARFNDTIAVLKRANEALVEAQLHVGYRTRDEILLFSVHADEIHPLFRDRAGRPVDPLDLALTMKVLPRISGGSTAIGRVLKRLVLWAHAGDPKDDQQATEAVMKGWRAHRGDQVEGARFPRTCARLCLMLDRYADEGFTSFWL
jgi:hypothetical protein